MKAIVLYHPKSSHTRVVESYVREFASRGHGEISLVSLETKDGVDTARLYDIVQYPAILVTRDDGQLLKDWQGEQLPLMDEVVGYLHS